MNKDTQARLDRLPAALARLDAQQREADELMIAIIDSGERGAQAALARTLGIKPQSLRDRITAARSRIAARTT